MKRLGCLYYDAPTVYKEASRPFLTIVLLIATDIAAAAAAVVLIFSSDLALIEMTFS